MVSVEDFSRLVSGIYTAAVAPAYWEPTLREVHQALDGISCALCTPSGTVWTIENSNLPADAAQSYADYFCHHDYVLDTVQNGAVGAIRTGAELIDPHRATEFYTDWMQPNLLEDGLFVRLTEGRNRTCFVVASPRRAESFATSDRMKVFNGLIPHLQQAMRIRDKLAALDDKAAELAGALEVVRHGVLIVARDHRVVTLNSVAERILRAEDGLCLRSCRVAVMNPRDAIELCSAVSDAVIGDGTGVRGARSFTCSRPSGKRAYILHVLPSHRRQSEESLRRAMALLLVIDPQDEPEPAAALLRRLYHLTRTEAGVALHVMHGVDLKQISEMLSVSVTTVRTHLQHVFDKTDTHRQAELVHLLHVIDP